MKNLCCYILEMSRQRGGKIAVSDERAKYSFHDIVKRAIHIANIIYNEVGTIKNRPIAVFMDKSVETLAVFYGILFGNNVYVPLDTKAPIERLEKILATLQPECIVTEQRFISYLTDEFPHIPIILYDKEIEDDYSQLFFKAIDTDPAYILFTSGSTGIPKGVVLNHRAIIDRVSWMCENFGIDDNFIFGNQAPFYFDASMPDIFIPFFSGAELHIIPENKFLIQNTLIKYINEKNINALIWVPTALCMLVERNYFLTLRIEMLKLIIFCGEIMPTKYINCWRDYYPDTRFVNMYGPTEAAYACTYFEVDRKIPNEEMLPIGFPCGNTDVFLLDEDDRLIEQIGEMGEICIRGTTVAMGYYNAPDQTSEHFRDNPLKKEYSEKIYRTGDLAQYNSRNELLFFGRKDHQIKHKGYRIELGEIENAVYTLSYIKKNCVIYDPNQKKIVLFCTLCEEHSQKDIYLELKKKLPAYMLPSLISLEDEIVLNANGKIDRIYYQNKVKEM